MNDDINKIREQIRQLRLPMNCGPKIISRAGAADLLEAALIRIEELEVFVVGEAECHISYKEFVRLQTENETLQEALREFNKFLIIEVTD